ncbi:MAG: cation diffusion facilitator family transporter, partial [Chloroflexi bacterium]|nr:cation diffusion facilitator family transporter [Chloroflexota bacterium]
MSPVTRILWLVLGLNLPVTAVKLAIGFSTGALAVVADGFHSLVDSSSNLVGLAGVWAAARPVDANHPYGHRRFETMATLSIGVLLLAAAWEILRAIVERLTGGPPPEITPTTLLVVALTLPVNLAIVAFETRAGRRLNSQILLADATHTRTDVYVTLGVLASLLGALLGLAWLDMVVAAVVVGVIVRAAWHILRAAAL